MGSVFASRSAEATGDVIGVVAGLNPLDRVAVDGIILAAETVIGQKLQAARGLVQKLRFPPVVNCPGVHGPQGSSGDAEFLDAPVEGGAFRSNLFRLFPLADSLQYTGGHLERLPDQNVI